MQLSSSKIILSILLMVSCAGLADTWTDQETGRTWSYRMIGDTAEITQGQYSNWTGDLIIPDNLGDIPVTSIGQSAFSGCSNLVGVALHNEVVSIGRRAFYGCCNLVWVQMSTNVTSIEDYAFHDCSNLVGVAIHNGITNIGVSAFTRCSGLASVTIPSSVKRIGKWAFYQCNGLENITICDGVKSIEEFAFANYGAVESIIVPDSVTNIERRAFNTYSAYAEGGIKILYIASNYSGHLDSDWPIVCYEPFHTVSFDLLGGEGDVAPIIVKVATKYGPLPLDVHKVGYTFVGWSLGGERIFEDSIVTNLNDHVLVAQWSPVVYEVGFNLAGGTEVSGILNVTFDATYGELPTPSRMGYSFDGWFINGRKITSDTIVSTPSNHVLTASWLPNKYPMVFNANGGVGGGTLMQEYDTPVSAPEVSRAGYSFVGWSPSVLINVPAESVEFVAQWMANNYEVSFDLMGGIGEFDPLTLSYDGNYGELPVPDREGYAFQGWSLNGNMVNADTILATSSNHVLTAVWQGNEYMVSLDAKGGIVEPGTKSVVYGDEYGDLPIPVREGYDFVAWLCNGHVIESDTVVSTSSNHTFVASWDANQYQVSFDPKGGNLQGGSASKIVTYDAEYGELPEPSRVGYTFVRWMLGDEEISSMSVVTTACNHTLSAAWTANKYVVELNSNEGTLDPELSTIEVVFDSAYGALPQPERVGYGFVGWATSMIGGEVIGPDSLATTNQVLYALWEANQYQIVYDANNDSGETYAADAVYDEDVEIAENPFVWLAHVFVGWSDSPDGEVAYEPEEIVRNLTAVPDGVVTLYAMWEPLVVAVPAVSPGDGTSFIEDTCLVTITCESEGADIYYSTKGTPPRIKESYLYTGPFEIADTTQIMAVAVKEGVMSEVSVVTISRRELTIPEAAGAVELPFETGGDAEWEPTADKTSPNGLSVKSGTIGCAEYGSSNVTWLVTSVEGAGTLSFQWKVDCEHDYTGMCLWDHLVVSTNGVEVTRIDGSQDWAQVSLSFGSGSNVIRWAFVKDDEDDDSAPFEDRAWISCVTWTPAVIIEDTTYDADEMPEMVTAQPGVTLRVKVETEPTADEIAAFMARIVISPKSAEQSSDYFKVVGTYDSAIGSVVMSVAIDEEAIELNRTATEILGAVMDKSFTGGEVTIPSAKQGLWYGIVVVDDLSRLNEAAEFVSLVQAGNEGVKLDITRPAGPTAFFKVIVRDEVF